MILETRQPRVLVVDDDAATRMLCSVNLELSGLEVLEAEDGLHGLERARADTPDLVVLDVMMPGLDGFELAERLRRDRRTRSIPLLFVTAESAPANQTRARALGALGYVTKPFDPVTLASLVAGALADSENSELHAAH
jgi:CheY-like chemotaxis protein